MNDHHQFQVHGDDSPTLLGRLALMLNRNRVAVRMLEMRPREQARDISIRFEICCTRDRAVRVANQLRQLVEVNDISWSTKVAALR
jgi:acetolactate synthase regulatory subunit